MIGKEKSAKTAALFVAVVGVSLCAASRASAQAPATERAYYRAVAGYFRVTPEEVAILGEWDLRAEEVPVVLFVAGQAGVPPDFVVSLRPGWPERANRFRFANSIDASPCGGLADKCRSGFLLVAEELREPQLNVKAVEILSFSTRPKINITE